METIETDRPLSAGMKALKGLMLGAGGLTIATIVCLGIMIAAAPPLQSVRVFRTLSTPVTQIVSYGEGVGLLDTRNGSISELRGSLDNQSSQLSWFLRVEGVEGTSGHLEMQSPQWNRPDALFLVDVMTGETWILRDRGNNNGTWESVR